MLTHDACVKLLESQYVRFTSGENARLFTGWNKTMQYFFPDSGEYYHIVFTNGAPGPLTAGQAQKPEIEYRMDTDTFAAIMSGALAPMKAWQQGKVKLKASLPDMMALQKLA